MSKNTVISAFLIVFAFGIPCGYCEYQKLLDPKPIELKLSVYPEELAIGDTCYIVVTATNHSDESITVYQPRFGLVIGVDIVNIYLKHQGESRYRNYAWGFPFEWLHDGREVGLGYLLPITVASGETATFIAARPQFPPLESLHKEGSWRSVLWELKNAPEGKLAFEFGIQFLGPNTKKEPPFERNHDRLTLEEVKIKLRNDEEMTMIEQWYQNTPEEFFPKIVTLPENLRVNKSSINTSISERKKRMLPIPGDILWHCMPLDNRYPGEPNNPTTWQGWKELEENITPSTMRDEIRLTRILIQYCDTKDEKVLQELKEWFAGMNEVQRVCMAKSVRDRVHGCYGYNALLPSFRDLYHAIREYDLTAKTDGEVEWLKKLELLK